MTASFSLSLPREPVASALARDAVRERLGELMPATVLADVLLVVSELVTNAMLHGEGDIEMRIEFDGSCVKGEVIDRGGGFEREVRESGIEEVGGHGLAIVGQLAESWGVHEGTTHVWFEIGLRSDDGDLEEPQLGHPGDEQLPDV